MIASIVFKHITFILIIYIIYYLSPNHVLLVYVVGKFIENAMSEGEKVVGSYIVFIFLFNLFRYVIAYYVKLTTKPLNLFSYKNIPRPLTCIFNKGQCSPMKEQHPIPELITKVQLVFK